MQCSETNVLWWHVCGKSRKPDTTLQVRNIRNRGTETLQCRCTQSKQFMRVLCSKYDQNMITQEEIVTTYHVLPLTMYSLSREQFPQATVLPMIENVVDWLDQWQVGIGLMGGQGAEVNNLKLHIAAMMKQHVWWNSTMFTWQKKNDSWFYLFDSSTTWVHVS